MSNTESYKEFLVFKLLFFPLQNQDRRNQNQSRTQSHNPSLMKHSTQARQNTETVFLYTYTINYELFPMKFAHASMKLRVTKSFWVKSQHEMQYSGCPLIKPR